MSSTNKPQQLIEPEKRLPSLSRYFDRWLEADKAERFSKTPVPVPGQNVFCCYNQPVYRSPHVCLPYMVPPPYRISPMKPPMKPVVWNVKK